MYLTPWSVDPVKILTRRELAAVLADLECKSKRSPNAWMNLIIVRLACCTGLRVSEIAALQLDDVRVDSGRPHLRVRPEGAKGSRSRIVPLWWDAGTLDDLKVWKRDRERTGTRASDPFVCCLWPSRYGGRLIRHTVR